MYSCSTLHVKYFRCWGPQKYISSSNTKHEIEGKTSRYSLRIMKSQCKMILMCRSQYRMMSLCAVSSRELEKQTWDGHIYVFIIIISRVPITILQNFHWFLIYPSTDLVQFHGIVFGFFGSFTVFTIFRISNFFDLSTTDETWLVEMRIWCIKIGIVLVLYYNISICHIFDTSKILSLP
jgi:hypothetical protein